MKETKIPIIILDEATSSLDNESEFEVYVLTENGIAESGTHQELLAQGGI